MSPSITPTPVPLAFVYTDKLLCFLSLFLKLLKRTDLSRKKEKRGENKEEKKRGHKDTYPFEFYLFFLQIKFYRGFTIRSNLGESGSYTRRLELFKIRTNFYFFLGGGFFTISQDS